jgi:histidinol-phosphate aminotransferase
MSKPTPRPGIMDIKPYVGGEGRVAGVSRLVRLASNENPLGSSDKAKKAFSEALEDLHRYPDGAAAGLRNALGKEYDMDPARIVCGTGSDELISLLIRSYAGIGDEVIHSQYGFLMYANNARSVGAQPVSAPEIDMRTDIDAVLAAVTPKTKIVFLANPNNPTGSYLTTKEMTRLRDSLPEHVLLVIDAAYTEFVDKKIHKDYEDGRNMVDKYDNVVMLRTFSKIHGLAALRVGWSYCPPEVADVLNRVRPAFNVSVPAQAAAVAALADKEFIQKTIDMTNAGRIQVSEGLKNMGIKVYPSVGNFLLADFGDKADSTFGALKAQGIFIRPMAGYQLPQCLRITVGTAEDNSLLLDGIRQALGLKLATQPGTGTPRL